MALPGVRPGRALASLLRGLGRCALDDRDHWPLWLPVALGAGVALYFGLRAEPPLWLGAACTLGAAVAAVAGRRHLGVRTVAVLLATLWLGFTAAQWRTVWVATPQLAARLGPVSVNGRVVSVQRDAKGVRLILDRLRVGRLDPAQTPARIRLRVRRPAPGVTAGTRVVVRAVLLPVPPPVSPGAYDFQRAAFFQRIGATGFAVGDVAAYRLAAPSSWLTPALWLQRLRHDATERIVAALGGAAGGIASALLTGERGHIPAAVLDHIRAAGLAHLLAISGLHIGMVAGFAFFALRLGLALVPGLALRFPIKKWAAVFALVVGLAYLLLTGATVPTQRAFLMLAIVLTGVFLDRVALSMRLVAWAAAALLLTAPESLLTPSFQMSFGAVVALIAAYEAWAERRRRNPAPASLARRLAHGVLGLGVTSAVAASATAPFAIFHFQKFAVYGLLANLAAVPIMTFWIMPLGLVALLAMPFGLEALPLALMGRGIDAMLAVADTVASLPAAQLLIPQITPWGLGLVAAGGLWLCLWRQRWRWFGLPAILAGLLTSGAAPVPDILVTADGRLAAVRTAAGELALSSTRRARYAARRWLDRYGQRRARRWTERPGRATLETGTLNTGPPPVRCDADGCVFRRGRRLVAFVTRPEAFAEDCVRAELLITPLARPPTCPGPRLIIDARALRLGGSHAVWLRDGALRVATDRRTRGTRPWVPGPAHRTGRLRYRRRGQKWRIRPTRRP